MILYPLDVSLVRALAERGFRGRAWRRRLPREFGSVPFYVSPDAALRWLVPGRRGFDQQLLRTVDELVSPGMNVWDIGANVGLFSFAAAARSRTGSVVAVEPDPFLVNLILKSTQLSTNRSLDVAVVSAAISDRQELSRLQVAKRGRSSNALVQAGGRSQMGGTRAVLHVPTLTLDDFLGVFPNPDLIKIDVEGAETLVLNGALQVLREARPRLIVEVGSKQSDEVLRSLVDAHYVVLDAAASRGDRIPLDYAPWETLGIPEERYASRV